MTGPATMDVDAGGAGAGPATAAATAAAGPKDGYELPWVRESVVVERGAMRARAERESRLFFDAGVGGARLLLGRGPQDRQHAVY